MKSAKQIENKYLIHNIHLYFKLEQTKDNLTLNFTMHLQCMSFSVSRFLSLSTFDWKNIFSCCSIKTSQNTADLSHSYKNTVFYLTFVSISNLVSIAIIVFKGKITNKNTVTGNCLKFFIFLKLQGDNIVKRDTLEIYDKIK